MSPKRRWARSVTRQYREYDRDVKRANGRHTRWTEEGIAQLNWEAWVAEHPEDAGLETPF